MDFDELFPGIKELNPYFDDVMEFRMSLNAETDRGCALMSAAFLDNWLRNLLNSFFVEDERITGDFLSPNGPLGTFSSRIDLAYLLGLISKKAHRDLHLIRKIRNDFGHKAEPLSFETGYIKSRTLELYYDISSEQRPRQKFTRVVLGVLSQLTVKTLMNEHRNSHPDAEFPDSLKQEFEKLVRKMQNSIEEES